MTAPHSIKISTLVQKLTPRAVVGPSNVEIFSLHYDSRQVVPGSAFFALPGAVVDGHRFIDAALQRGAQVIVYEVERPLPPQVTGILVDDARQALALAAASYYDDPTADMLVVGVTGTNGKTTVSYLLEALLKSAGRRPAVIGTVNYRFEDQLLTSTHTTPESLDLQALAARFCAAGADTLILEVSSHALEQRRVDGIAFDLGIFTNLTPEHLDYHGDLESYFQAKCRLFTGLGSRGPCQAVVDIDDVYGKRLANQCQGLWSCGLSREASVYPATSSLSLAGIEAHIVSPAGDFELHSTLRGEFNLSNLLCAATAGLALGLDPATVAAGLAAATAVPGRLEPVDNGLGALILVDYAHTADALDKALAAVIALKPRRVITLFGCGGDRDRSKRPMMGEVAAQRSDLVVVTSDNPRSENPVTIIEDIRPGLDKVFASQWSLQQAAEEGRGGYVVIEGRRAAIDFAVSQLGTGDLLLVAGKGHEDYQLIGDRRLHFDDREELRRALQEREGRHEA
jgi:UDP-N-acetylmuramoyl-L-alanyl-D-glutamate--2,6-diaminopimelate ligase